MATATATASPKAYEFTIDDDELEDPKPSSDQATMCNFYKLNLPASASILSKQIAKSQAKRAKKDTRSRQRKDLSVVREADETRASNSEENSQNAASPRPMTGLSLEEGVTPSAPASQYGGRSRIDGEPLGVQLQRQASLPDRREMEPMDEEEAELLAMLLKGIERNEQRLALNGGGNQPLQNQNQNPSSTLIPPSPGLPRLPPGAKVSEWLLERSTSPDNLSVVSSVLLEDSGLILNYQNSDDEDDIFFDAPEEKIDVVMNSVEHEMQGLSLNRNMVMTQSLVRVEEETTTTDGGPYDAMNGRTGRSTSVSPRPSNEQFVRNTNGSATFNVKHSSTLARLQKLTSPLQMNNGNSSSNTTSTTTTTTTVTPLSSRTTRSVLRVHNVNSMPRPQKQQTVTMNMSKSSVDHHSRRAASGVRIMPPSTHATPPTVTINPSTPSRPASVASSAGGRSGMSQNVTSVTASNLEGLQDLIQMQEEALRRAALDSNQQQGQEEERKMSWHSDQEAQRQSTSTHSSLGSLCSSKSIDGAHALSKMGTPGTSRIPTPRSRLPTPRGSNLPKRVHSVAAAVRFATSKPESTATGNSAPHDDECF